VHTIISVFPKEEFLLAGYLTACWTGARFFPYFHNCYVENRKAIGLLSARWLQSRVFARAERVLVISEGLAELYRARYPAVDIFVLPHSFNEDVPAFVPPPAPRSPPSLVLSGNINESCRDAAVRVSQAVAQHPNATLKLLSGTAPSVVARLGMLHARVRHATVTREVLLSELSGADIVVLPHGLSGAAAPEEYQTIFPTRTIEYLICGRPILAHAPADCFLTRFLKEHDCALVVDQPSCAAIVDAIECLRTDAELRSRLVRNALRTAQAFRAPKVAANLRQHLAGAESKIGAEGPSS
jgi:glycosyltransferase involved in cell wall biosynthesis